MLIDTGAGMTCLCKTVIAQLGLQPTGSIGIHTPSTQGVTHQCSTYDADLTFPTAPTLRHIAALPLVESDFSAQGIQGLIGRDVLKIFRMTYSGPDSLLLLSS
jgi:hypothetical protein